MQADLQLIGRHQGVVDLAITNNPTYRAFRVSGGLTLDAAFAAPVAMMTVPVGRDYRSRTLRRRGNYGVDDMNRGLTRIVYDPNDFVSATLPGDEQVAFLRVAGIDHGGIAMPEGPVLIVPLAGFLSFENVSLPVRGTAPAVAALTSNYPPSDALWLRTPRASGDVTVVNAEAAMGDSLFVSIAGMPEFEIPADSSFTFKNAGAVLFSFRGEGGTVAFRATFAIVNGIQA
jgi:hypothetical protein